MIYKMWKQEYSTEGFLLKHDPPEDFTRCHWQKSERVKPLWIVYRALIALYFFASFLYTVVPIGREIPEENRTKYLIFLTHWTYVLEVILFQLAFIIVVIRALVESKKSYAPMTSLPWYYVLNWALYTIILSSALVVTIIFWTFVYDPVMFPASASNLIEHAFNSIFMVIDFILTGFPIRALHFYLPFIYGVIYGIFSVIYQMSGGTGVKGIIPIYKILDWRKPGEALFTCFLSFTLLMFLHFLFSLLYMFKVWIKKKSHSQENGH